MLMKNIILLLLLFYLSVFSGFGQEVRIKSEQLQRPTELPIQIRLWELCNAANSGDLPKMDQIMANSRIYMRNDGKVNVRIIHPRDNRISPGGILSGNSIEIFREDPEQTSIYIDPKQLITLAEKLPEGYVLYQETPADPMNEGPSPQLHNSVTYSGNGAPGGAGIKIAIIDVGFNGLQNAIANGRAPANYDSTDYSTSGVLNGSTHGVAVLETVFDHAPNAEYFIYKVINSSQCVSAIYQAWIDDVDIINMSLGYSGLGWEDDDNNLCTAANLVADVGILLFVSSGNSKKMHWQGNFSDNDADNWHGWSGNNELNTITLQDSTTLSCSFTWDPDLNTNYNIYITDITGTQVLDSDEMSGTTFESVSFLNTTGVPVTVAIAVKKVSGPAVEFEILCRTDGVGSSVVNDQLNFRVASSSITWPAACSADNVIGVAGVDRPDFDNPSGTSGISTVYSSEGPTNDGRQGVDITGATRTTIGGGGQFFGTSCSSPNAAGATAALWATQPNLDADNIRYLLFRKAQIYKDWGTPGLDYI